MEELLGMVPIVLAFVVVTVRSELAAAVEVLAAIEVGAPVVVTSGMFAVLGVAAVVLSIRRVAGLVVVTVGTIVVAGMPVVAVGAVAGVIVVTAMLEVVVVTVLKVRSPVRFTRSWPVPGWRVKTHPRPSESRKYCWPPSSPIISETLKVSFCLRTAPVRIDPTAASTRIAMPCVKTTLHIDWVTCFASAALMVVTVFAAVSAGVVVALFSMSFISLSTLFRSLARVVLAVVVVMGITRRTRTLR